MTARVLPIKIFNVFEDNSDAGFEGLRSHFDDANPGYSITKTKFDRTGGLLVAPENFVRFSWLLDGNPKVHGEEIKPGDVVIQDQEHAAAIEGSGLFVSIQTGKINNSPFAGVQRLAKLKDVSGGCNISDGSLYRRLQVTWQEVAPSVNPDGVNVIGCHTVMMNDDGSSRAHYHPSQAIGGGKPQTEMYFVLDPHQTFTQEHLEKLWNPNGRHGIETWDNPESQGECYTEKSTKTGNTETWRRMSNPGQFKSLKPGDVVYIDSNIGHRGVGTLANVVTLPGFKPGNEFYLANTFLAHE